MPSRLLCGRSKFTDPCAHSEARRTHPVDAGPAACGREGKRGVRNRLPCGGDISRCRAGLVLDQAGLAFPYRNRWLADSWLNCRASL